MKAAIAWEPGNADYHALLAEHEESTGASPEPQLLEAAKLSPLSASFLVRAALRAEVDRDYSNAEQYLNRAAAVDRKFAPRWALLNFYFRRGSATGVWPAGFWPAINSALEMSSPQDTDAVFQLAWEQTQDAGAILSHLPADKVVLTAYLRFLIRTDRMEAAGTVARRLGSVSNSDDVPLLLGYCERAIPSDMDSAVAVWNLLAGRQLIGASALNPANGTILTNKNFTATPVPRGFDWQMPSVDGVFVTQANDGAGISVHFDGSEPENCEILKQTMPVIPGGQYRIEYEYSSFGHPLQGLRWEVISADKTLAASPELDSAKDDTQGGIVFRAEGNSVRLSLRYQRPLGTVRAEGTIAIHRLADRIVK